MAREILTIGIPKAWRGSRSGISTTDRQEDRQEFLFNGLYYNQFENKARTDEDADTHRSRIQDKHPSICHVFICRRKLTKCMWSVHHTPEALTLQNTLFSVIKTA